MTFEDKVPQYTSAVGGFTGALAAQRLLSRRYGTAGQIAGTIAGTGVGIESGEVLGRLLDRARTRVAPAVEKAAEALPAARALLKLAQLPEPPPDTGEAPQEQERVHPALGVARAVGAPLLAFGAGTGAGYLGQLGVEKLIGHHLTPPRLRVAAPLLGGAFGLAYNQYKALEARELRRALEANQNEPAGRIPA